MVTIVALWGMVRPFIMLSVILVYMLGTLVAWSQGYAFNLPAFNYGFVALILVSASIHYVNEYADHETDALTTSTPFSGGSGVLKKGQVARELALQAGWVTLILGILLAFIGLLLNLINALSVVILVVGAFGGWMYSMPPLKLAWHGWGELDNALLGGLLLPLYGYAVQTGGITVGVALAFVPFTMLAFLNLLATTWADREADAQVGKYTLATQWSIVRLRRLYIGVATMAVLLLPLSKLGIVPCEVAYGSLLVIPFVILGWLRYTRTDFPMASVTSMLVLLIVQMAFWWQVGID